MARNDDVRLEGRDPLELVAGGHQYITGGAAELREEVRGAQEDTAAKLTALKTERPYSFRKKGREEQYVFNAAVNSKIAEAGLDAEKEGLTKGEQLMAEVNKGGRPFGAAHTSGHLV